MFKSIIISLLISIPLWYFALSTYFFTKKINEVNKIIFDQFDSSNFDSHENESLSDFKNSVDILLKEQLMNDSVYALSVKSHSSDIIKVSYNIRKSIHNALITFDLVRL